MKSLFFDKKIILSLIAAVLVLACMFMFGPKESLDAKFFYDGKEAWRVLYGVPLQESRRYHVCEVFDLVFIGLYSSLLFLVFGKFSLSLRARTFWALAPGVVDLAETIFVLYALPKFLPLDVLSYLGYITALKWSLAMASVAYLAWRARRGQCR